MRKYLHLYHVGEYESFISYTEVTEGFKQLLVDLWHSVMIQKELFGADATLEVEPDLNIYLYDCEDGIYSSCRIINVEDLPKNVLEKPANCRLRVTEKYFSVEARPQRHEHSSSTSILIEQFLEDVSR